MSDTQKNSHNLCKYQNIDFSCISTNRVHKLYKENIIKELDIRHLKTTRLVTVLKNRLVTYLKGTSIQNDFQLFTDQKHFIPDSLIISDKTGIDNLVCVCLNTFPIIRLCPPVALFLNYSTTIEQRRFLCFAKKKKHPQNHGSPGNNYVHVCNKFDA